MSSQIHNIPVVKTRDIHNHHMNSTVWDSFKFRDDDIVLVTCPIFCTRRNERLLHE